MGGKSLKLKKKKTNLTNSHMPEKQGQVRGNKNIAKACLIEKNSYL